MKLWVKVLLVTIAIAVPAMMFGRVIWPPAEGGPEPTAGQLPFFIFVSFVEALALGLGISFLLFGLPVMREISADSKLRAWAMCLSIGWFLISWWPHGNLHISVGENMQGLLYIEYGFHVTLIIAGAILAYCFLSLMRERTWAKTRVS